MQLTGKVIKGRYFDSVFLMKLSKDVSALEGVIDSSIVIATEENLNLLRVAGLYQTDFQEATANDLVIAIKGKELTALQQALEKTLEMLSPKVQVSETGNRERPQSLQSALTQLPGANLALISIAGKYAATQAMKALEQGLHVMLFSDNVSLEEEIKLKQYGAQHGLFVMGPDCGTAILNGVPLAFANAVSRGPVGVVAASGTGMQEVTCLLSNLGSGVSQAIGTGGRDIKKEVGGSCFLMGLQALMDDPKTKVILLVSKPPHTEVMDKIVQKAKQSTKPVVAMFLGAKPEQLHNTTLHYASNLAEAATMAAKMAHPELNLTKFDPDKLKNQANAIAAQISKGQYVRGLYSGGTFCSETQLILSAMGFSKLHSNAPAGSSHALKNSLHSVEHTILDLGEDEFTVGRPHPMIDFSLRNRRILEEAQAPETALLVLDLVLGYGAHLHPMQDLLPTLQQAVALLPVVMNVTGTDRDPQGRNEIIATLQALGVIVTESNAEAATLIGLTLQQKGVHR